jgi:murein DD-endopeptidase MepM/ murein hydrolase activator NlpD
MRRLPALLLAAALLVLPDAAAAAASDASGSGGVPATPPPSGGDTQPGEPSSPSRRRDRRRPILRAFSVSPAKFFLYGRPARVAFRIDDRSRSVRVRLEVVARGRVKRRIDLGEKRTRARHSQRLSGRGFPEGRLTLRIRATDPAGNRLTAAGGVAASAPLELRGHHFPLPRSVGYGGAGSRFGAPRSGGRRHQGQDMPAPMGMPVLAPRGGVVKTIAYQASGAGNYIVLEGAGERRDYVFMHLQTGTTRVRRGERVRTGEQLARVGNTGIGTGPHLHFEIWVGGGWYTGGHPIDPLPHLRRWERWS